MAAASRSKSAAWWIERIQKAYDANDARAAWLYPEVSVMLDLLERGEKMVTIIELDRLVDRIRNA